MKKRLGIHELNVDPYAKDLLNLTIKDIEKWHPDDIGHAAIVMTRHALLVKLEINKSVSLMEYYKSEIAKARKDGIDDLIEKNSYLLRNETIKRNTLFDIPQHLLEFASAIKKLFDKKVDRKID